MAIPREARRITYSSEIRKLKSVPLTERQHAIVVGALLGDACLGTNWSNTNYRFQVTRSARQKEYIQWQYGELAPFILTPPRWYERTRSYTIRTISHPEFSRLRAEYYPQGKKTLPENLEKYMVNGLMLASWFMDDGNAIIRGGTFTGYHLNTQSFSYIENVLLAELFKRVFGIHAALENNNGYYRLRIGQKNSRETFREMIEPFVIPSMQYKLGYISDSS